MQQKNLIVFFLVSAAILISWTLIRSLIWPPPPKSIRPPDARLYAGLPGQLSTGVSAGLPGIGPALSQVVQVAVADYSADEKKVWLAARLAQKEKAQEQPKPAAPVAAKKQQPAKPAVAAQPHKEVELGDE